MQNLFTVEALEERRLLSVTAAQLAASLLKGTTWTYKSTTGSTSVTTTTKVIGAAKVGKINCTEVDATVKTSTGTTTTKSYFNLNSKLGLLLYKISASSTNSGFSTTIVDTPNPYNVVYPVSLTAGKTYSYKWSDVSTTSLTGIPGSTKQTLSVAFSAKLISDKTVKVTVPAGTFSCYQIQTTTKTTVNGKTTTATQTNYISPTVG